MTSIEDRLTRAEKAPKPHRDVDVYLGGDFATRVAELEQEREALKKDTRLGDPRPKEIADAIAAVQAEAADSIMVLRFRRLPAEEWADITAAAPMRIDAAVDRMYGYNVHDAGRTAAPLSGVEVTKDETGAETEVELTEDQWARLFPLLAGVDFSRICDAIFALNDYAAQQGLDAARKASRAGTGATSA